MILESLLLQTKLFLQEDMGIEMKNQTTSILDTQSLHLKRYTSMIGVGGKVNLMIVISFDENLLDTLVELFMDGEEVLDEEVQEIRESVTGEVINTILGLALPTFPNRGKGVTITPPISINDSKILKKHKDSKIATTEIFTDFGTMDISVIGDSSFIK